jgi:hypothetical protein
MKLQDTSYKTNVITDQAQPAGGSLKRSLGLVTPAAISTHRSTLIILLAALLLTSSASAAVIYVDIDATGSANGSSWQNAYTDLQTALDAANGSDDIRVAQGTYHPNDADPNQDQFDLVHNVDVCGGYAGYGEADPNQRDWVNNVTILKAARPGVTNPIVVDANEVTATISGFTITDGWTGVNVRNDSSLTIVHCVITDNGGGIHCRDNSSINVAHCRISESYYDGINANFTVSSMTVRNCEIRDNGTLGIFSEVEDNAVIKNNLIHHNGWGIGFDVPDSHLIRNNTIVDNHDYGVSNTAATSTLALSNCIIWGNYEGATDPYSSPFALTYSCIDDSNFVSGPNNTIGDNPASATASISLTRPSQQHQETPTRSTSLMPAGTT